MFSELLPYPRNSLSKLLFKLPVHLYRAGMGRFLGWMPIMILTTRGATSGLPRYTALEYRRHGSKIYVIASWGEESRWMINLKKDPYATVKFGRNTYGVRAERVNDASEAVRATYMFSRAMSFARRLNGMRPVSLRDLNDTANEIIVMRFDILNQPMPLPAVPADRRWVLGSTLAAFAAVTVALEWLIHRGGEQVG